MTTPDHHEVLFVDDDDTRYRARIVVEKSHPEGRWGMVCEWPEWPTCWPGRLAKAHDTIERLVTALGQRHTVIERLTALTDTQSAIIDNLQKQQAGMIGLLAQDDEKDETPSCLP